MAVNGVEGILGLNWYTEKLDGFGAVMALLRRSDLSLQSYKVIFVSATILNSYNHRSPLFITKELKYMSNCYIFKYGVL